MSINELIGQLNLMHTLTDNLLLDCYDLITDYEFNLPVFYSKSYISVDLDLRQMVERKAALHLKKQIYRCDRRLKIMLGWRNNRMAYFVEVNYD